MRRHSRYRQGDWPRILVWYVLNWFCCWNIVSRFWWLRCRRTIRRLSPLRRLRRAFQARPPRLKPRVRSSKVFLCRLADGSSRYRQSVEVANVSLQSLCRTERRVLAIVMGATIPTSMRHFMLTTKLIIIKTKRRAGAAAQTAGVCR